MRRRKVLNKASNPISPDRIDGSAVLAQNALMKMVANDLMTRSTLAYGNCATGIGVTHGGARDIYQILGYKKKLEFSDYLWRYERQDIATRVVTAYPSAVWSMKPRVFETKTPGDETAFEKAFANIVIKNKAYHYLTRADKLSGIGRFGIVVLGFADNRALNTPLIKSSGLELIYMRPYHEGSVAIQSYEEDSKNPRYGLPTMYKIKTVIPEISNSNVAQTTKSISDHNQTTVHWSRVLHILPELGSENDIYAEPRLKNIYNRLQDVETIAGGGSEMFWRGAFQGMAFKNDEGATMTPESKAALTTEIDNYVNNMQRYLKLQNMDVKQLETAVADPKNHLDMQLTLISAGKGIPKRILYGSERGELASNQDENNWLSRVDERRVDHAELLILRPFIDRLIEYGALPEPETPYTVEWPDLYSASGIDKAKIAEANMRALKDYMLLGGDQVIPVDVFLEQELKYSTSLVERCMAAFTGIMDEEDNEINNDNQTIDSEAT